LDYPNYCECKEFISTYSSHCSKKEDIIKHNVEEINNENLDDNETEKLNISVFKQGMYIEEFAIRKCREFNLSDEVKKNLISSIFSKLSNKTLLTKSIIISKYGTINYIVGLNINENGYYFDENSNNRYQAVMCEIGECKNVPQKMISFKCSKKLTVSLKRHFKF